MAESDFGKCMVKVPIREAVAGFETTGRSNPPYTYMSNELVPGCNAYVEISWIWEMPTPNPIDLRHSHNYDEIILNIGSDPHNPEYLGGVIEAYLGGVKQVTDKTCAVFIPKNVEHGPVMWNKFEKPHIQMAIVLGTGNRREAMPGGHKPLR